jgi:hypothetical protein
VAFFFLHLYWTGKEMAAAAADDKSYASPHPKNYKSKSLIGRAHSVRFEQLTSSFLMLIPFKPRYVHVPQSLVDLIKP